MTTTSQLLEQVFSTCRFAPTHTTREEVALLLIEAYNNEQPVHLTARQVCDYLGISRREFADQVELVLRPEFERA